MNPKSENKKVTDSMTESSKIVQSKDINGQNRLFGGRLMEWIDEVAALTAMRHCGGLVTTCAVDSLVFKHGAKLNQVVVLTGKVTYVGNTSLEVRVDTYVEEVESGERFAINHAYLILVHVNNNGEPTPIRYGLDLQSESEQAMGQRAYQSKEQKRTVCILIRMISKYEQRTNRTKNMRGDLSKQRHKSQGYRPAAEPRPKYGEPHPVCVAASEGLVLSG